MRLLVDMGNSRMKATYQQGDDIEDVFTVAYDGKGAFECLVDYIASEQVVTILCIVAVLGDAFEQQVKTYCLNQSIKLIWARSERQTHGVKNNYDHALSLGSDRFVALVGAFNQFPQQYCIVVDCGTAVTIDGLTNQGAFEGGVILPGLQLWGKSLMNNAHQLDESNLTSPVFFARNTADAIGGGSVYGLISAIEGIYFRMRQFFIDSGAEEASIKLVLCGGDAGLVAKHSNLKLTLCPHLVLVGLTHFH